MYIVFTSHRLAVYFEIVCNNLTTIPPHSLCVGHEGVVVSMLDFRTEGRWFDVQSLPSCCFLGQDTLYFSPSCLFPPRCINGHRRHSAGG